MFPGQGSQKIGMGKDLAQDFPTAKSTFEEADDVLKWKISELCFWGDEEELKQTENTQLAVLIVSLAAYRILKENGIVPSAVAGHSLGEYSALVASGVITFHDALKLVQKRAKLMSEAAENNPGGMLAILGLENSQVERICQEANSVGILDVANYNCLGQVVISGEFKALDLAAEIAQKMNAKRCIRLQVNGAFHSRLMSSAREGMIEAVANTEFCNPEIKLVQNVTANYVRTSEEICQNLIEQITNSVQWEKSMSCLISDGFSRFIEVGPGKVLSGLIRRIDRKMEVTNVETSSDVKVLI